MSGMVILVLVALVFSGGCIKGFLPGAESTQTTEVMSYNTNGTETPVAISGAAANAGIQYPAAEMTPAKSAAVTEASPILTPDPYPILHGTRINSTGLVNPIWCETCGYEFEKNYKLRGNATGLIVNVVEGPLYIIYTVTPQNDCLENPDSCRGDLKKSVNRPYLTITVRDNQTQEVVAEDGYGREYSSDTGKYEFEITRYDAEGNEITTTTTPGPRAIKIFREGTYHLTIQGNFIEVNVMIRTGASPTGVIAAGSTVPEQQQQDEWE